MSTVYLTSFTADLATSLAYADEDARLLTEALAEARQVPRQSIAVTKTPPEVDRQGVDYIVRILGGAASEGTPEVITVDVKRGSAGKSRYWRSPEDPDVIIETWSVVPSEYNIGVPGPLFQDRTLPDYWGLAYGDMPGVMFLVPAEALRRAAQRYRDAWKLAYGLRHTAPTAWGAGRYTTEFIPVPLSVVRAAISEA